MRQQPPVNVVNQVYALLCTITILQAGSRKQSGMWFQGHGLLFVVYFMTHEYEHAQVVNKKNYICESGEENTKK